MKKPRLTTIFSMILIFAGISLALYPTISNILAQKHASQAITEYNDEIKDMDEEKIDAVKEAMQQYNEQLGNAVTQDAIGEQQTGTSHVDMLDIGDVIGYLGRTGYSTTENTNNIDTPHLHFGLELIFDEARRQEGKEVWIDCYGLIQFLERSRCETVKVEGTKEWIRVYGMKEADPQRGGNLPEEGSSLAPSMTGGG